MLAQTLVEHFLLYLLAFLVCEHPVGKLRVPAEAVTTHLDTVLTTEIGDTVSQTEVPLTLCGVDLTWFPGVLSGDAVELLLDKLHLSRIRHVGLVHCYTNGEVVLVGILQSWACRIVNGASPLCKSCRTGSYKHRKYKENLFHFKITLSQLYN